MTDLIVRAFALAVLLAGSVDTTADQQDARAAAADSEKAAADSDQDSQQDAEQPTAEDVLRALLRQRPPNEVIPPASAALRDPTEVPRRLLPEGSLLNDQTGFVEYHAPWWVLIMDEHSVTPRVGQSPPSLSDPRQASGDVLRVKLLPNVILEKVVRTTRGAAQPVRFVVSGEMTVFAGQNYLLPRMVMRATTEETALEPKDVEPVVPPDASAEEVLEAFKKISPDRQVILHEPPSMPDAHTGGPSPGHPAILDGSPLVNRPGRLVREGPWWAFAFESDHRDHPEPPLKLLPNQSVELMAEATEGDNGGLVFVVSGEVTAFGGDNYLLPRVAIRRIDLGNLRK